MRRVGIVLGSGLGSLVERVEVAESVTFAEAGIRASTVPGHEGRFVLGRLAGAEVIVMQGRVHLYEGRTASEVTAGVRWMKERGIDGLILTNAAGVVNWSFEPGGWMAIADHLNLTGTSPLEGEPRFVDLSEVYDSGWRAEALRLAKELEIECREGIYAGVRGPQYETPAEIRMLRGLGADAVGMSTVLEAIEARALDLPVLGFSCLTNWGAGMTPEVPDHGDVIARGRAAAGAMARLLERLLVSG